jgi:chromosome segregation ATPase
MTTDERIDAIAKTLEQTAGLLATLAGAVASHEHQIGDLKASIAAHDRQIETILKLTEENARNWEQLQREWQAYLRRIPPQ